jgi:hypothetical protein
LGVVAALPAAAIGAVVPKACATPLMYMVSTPPLRTIATLVHTFGVVAFIVIIGNELNHKRVI